MLTAIKGYNSTEQSLYQSPNTAHCHVILQCYVVFAPDCHFTWSCLCLVGTSLLEREEIWTVGILEMSPVRPRDLQCNHLVKQCQGHPALLLQDAPASPG
jgi:hypothetical protein